MKVFEINTVYNSGSTGRITAQLKHAIESIGGECMAAYGRGHTDENHTFKIGSRADMYFHALMTRLTDQTAFYSTKNTLKLCEQIRKFAPDVIHLHNLHGYYLNVEVLFDFLKDFNRPIIWTLHDCWAFTGHCAYFTEVKCMQWKTHCCKCVQKTSYPASRLMDNCRENYRRKKNAFQGVPNLTIITPSNWLSNLVRQSFLADYPVKVVYNGVDTSQFFPTQGSFRTKYGIQDKIILLGVAQVWSPRKGLTDFINLSKTLDKQYQIVLIGLSKQQIRGLPSNIIGLERTDTINELAHIYSTADFFLNLSTEETFGLTVVEAIACGTWPIVYEGTACAEIVQLGIGTIVPRNNDAIKKALFDFRNTKNAKQIKRYSQIFSNERFVREMLDIYRQVMKL